MLPLFVCCCWLYVVVDCMLVLCVGCRCLYADAVLYAVVVCMLWLFVCCCLHVVCVCDVVVRTLLFAWCCLGAAVRMLVIT